MNFLINKIVNCMFLFLCSVSEEIIHSIIPHFHINLDSNIIFIHFHLIHLVLFMIYRLLLKDSNAVTLSYSTIVCSCLVVVGPFIFAALRYRLWCRVLVVLRMSWVCNACR